MNVSSRSVRRGRTRRVFIALLASTGLTAGALTTAFAQAATAADTVSYTATQTIPVPPASSYAGSGGGDGWALVMTPAAVYNVFHHYPYLTVACHLQADASQCWAPKTITGPDPADPENSSTDFAVSGQPGMWMDPGTEKLYVYATRVADSTSGVVCIDTRQPADNPNPFCGFTELSAVGEGVISSNGMISIPVEAGNRWYAFNYASGHDTTGTFNRMMCFDLKTKAACAAQPFVFDIGAGTESNGDFPAPAVAGFGSRIFVPVNTGGTTRLACFDVVTHGTCTGAWPVSHASVAGFHGSPFPLLDTGGAIIGVCVPVSGMPCFDLQGGAVTPPTGMTSVLTPNTGWNGPALVLGPRVYLPNGNHDQVQCYDFHRDESCLNFPKPTTGAYYMYTVNPDPQRPDCIWVNADGGSAQIQNFDAYTGGACGSGAIRILASRMVVPTQECTPNSYTSLRITKPEPDAYTSGSVTFLDASAQPIPGAADRPLDDTGAVDLSDLELNTESGLPQFLITLTGSGADPEEITVELSWTSSNDASCRPASVVTLSPDSGPPSTTFTMAYSCTTEPTAVILRSDDSAVPEAQYGPQTPVTDVDYTRTVSGLPPGSYVASVACNEKQTRSEVATVTSASPSPPAFIPVYIPTPSASPSPSESPSPSPTPEQTASESPSPTQSPAPQRAALRLFGPEQYLLRGRQARVDLRGEPDAPIELRCYTRPSTEYRTVRTDTLFSDGTQTFWLLLGASTRCIARYADDIQTVSNTVLLQVHTSLTITKVERVGVRTYTFSGVVAPAVDRRLVSLWRLGLGNPVLTEQVREDGGVDWTMTHEFVGTGLHRFQATVPGNLNHASGNSNVVTIDIR